MKITDYERQEQKIINSIIEVAEKAGFKSKFVPSEKNSNLYDQVVLTKNDDENTPFGKVNVQSNIGTTLSDPKEIIKSFEVDNNKNIIHGLVIKGIVETAKQYGRELTFEERLDEIADDIWKDHEREIKKSDFDKDNFNEWAYNATSEMFIYTEDAAKFMNEAISDRSNLKYDEDEYDVLSGGREERDTTAAYDISNKYITKKLEEKFEDLSNKLKNEGGNGPGF